MVIKALSDQQLVRYNRQISLRGFDIEKQEQLYNQRALIVGVGGLGCAASLYLACAGIGQLTLVDFDTISFSNLARQVLYRETDVGKLKVTVACQHLQRTNPACQITPIAQLLEDDGLSQLISQHDIVLDCTDNLMTRQQLNRLCYPIHKPLISGAVIRMEGLLTSFTYQAQQPCYFCLSQRFGQTQLTCAESGVLSPLVGVVGNLQAVEAIKVLTGFGQPLLGRLLMIDAMSMQFNEIAFSKLPHCPVCHHD